MLTTNATIPLIAKNHLGGDKNEFIFVRNLHHPGGPPQKVPSPTAATNARWKRQKLTRGEPEASYQTWRPRLVPARGNAHRRGEDPPPPATFRKPQTTTAAKATTTSFHKNIQNSPRSYPNSEFQRRRRQGPAPNMAAPAACPKLGLPNRRPRPWPPHVPAQSTRNPTAWWAGHTPGQRRSPPRREPTPMLQMHCSRQMRLESTRGKLRSANAQCHVLLRKLRSAKAKCHFMVSGCHRPWSNYDPIAIQLWFNYVSTMFQLCFNYG